MDIFFPFYYHYHYFTPREEELLLFVIIVIIFVVIAVPEFRTGQQTIVLGSNVAKLLVSWDRQTRCTHDGRGGGLGGGDTVVVIGHGNHQSGGRCVGRRGYYAGSIYSCLRIGVVTVVM